MQTSALPRARSRRTAAQGYDIIDLGTLGCVSSAGGAINASGQVTGTLDLVGEDTHAFLYSDGGMADLCSTYRPGHSCWANAIDDSGQIVGTVEHMPGGSQHAVLLTGGIAIPLGTLGGTSSQARGINNHGQIVGCADGWSGAHAFLHTHGRMHDLGTLPGGSSSLASAINDAGVVVGFSRTRGDTAVHAFRCTPGRLRTAAAMRDLGTLGGTFSYARAINLRGQIVGDSDLCCDSAESRAFLWTEKDAMQDLGVLEGGISSVAYGINDDGHVVGACDIGDNVLHAFLYRDGRMHDLNDALPARSGWVLTCADDINSAGQITGEGRNPQGEFHAFLLTPIV